MKITECIYCRFYSENWCYEHNKETRPNARSCPEGVPNEPVCESTLPNGDDCPGKPEYYADPALVYCRECIMAMIQELGLPGKIYRDGVEVDPEELMK